jgi:hypothetical protein
MQPLLSSSEVSEAESWHDRRHFGLNDDVMTAQMLHDLHTWRGGSGELLRTAIGIFNSADRSG